MDIFDWEEGIEGLSSQWYLEAIGQVFCYVKIWIHNFQWNFVYPLVAKKPKLRISRLWRTLQIPSEDSLCSPNSQETFVPLRLMAISFLSLSFQFGITFPWRKPLFWFSSEEKTTTGLIYRQKNQTKTPLEKNSQTDFSSTEYIYTNTQLQTSKQKLNCTLRNCKMGNSPNHSQRFPVSQVPNWRAAEGGCKEKCT